MDVEIYNYGWAKRMLSFLFQSESLPINPIKLGFFLDLGEGQIFSPELHERVTCSKMGSHLSSCKYLQLNTHFWRLGHLVPEI